MSAAAVVSDNIAFFYQAAKRDIYEPYRKVHGNQSPLKEAIDQKVQTLIDQASALNGTLKWQAVVLLSSNPLDVRYQVRFLPPVLSAARSLYTISLPSDRFLFVKLKNLCAWQSHPQSQEYWGALALFNTGISFANRQYHFLGGELPKGQKFRRENFAEVDSMPNSLHLWFYAPDDARGVHEVRNVLGKLSGQLPATMNARLKLGFSPINAAIEVDEDNVNVVEDVVFSRNGKDYKLTDGCGFISSTLVRTLPYNIVQGEAIGPALRRGDSYNKDCEVQLPAIIQIRCSCKQGLFKGCLIVTDDPELCPEDCVVFRYSMKKDKTNGDQMESGTRTDSQRNRQRTIIGVVNSFEHPALLEPDRRRELAYSSRSISRQVILLLAHLGVRPKLFLGILERNLKQLEAVKKSRHQALKLVLSCLSQQSSKQKTSAANLAQVQLEPDDVFLDDGMEIEEEELEQLLDDLSIDSINTRTLKDCEDSDLVSLDNSVERDFVERVTRHRHQGSVVYRNALEALYFLYAGHSLDEPQLAQLMDILYHVKLKTMLEYGSVSLEKTTYLVGAPDPYDFLQPNHVFVCLPREGLTAEELGDKDLICTEVEGEIVVTRYPMYHPGDIRKLTAVAHPRLQRLMSRTHGGVIFFSTQTDEEHYRSNAEEMSGGDYDGDMFLIIQHDEVVRQFKPAKARGDRATVVTEAVMATEVTADTFSDFGEAVSPASTSGSSRSSHFSPRVPYSAVDTTGLEQRLLEDGTGWDIFYSLLVTAQRNLLGRYANAWQTWADAALHPDAGDSFAKAQMEQCIELIDVALDAAKTGRKVEYDMSLMVPIQKRTFYQQFKDVKNKQMKDFPDTVQTFAKAMETIVVGKKKSILTEMFERVLTLALKTYPRQLSIDLDLLYVDEHSKHWSIAEHKLATEEQLKRDRHHVPINFHPDYLRQFVVSNAPCDKRHTRSNSCANCSCVLEDYVAKWENNYNDYRAKLGTALRNPEGSAAMIIGIIAQHMLRFEADVCRIIESEKISYEAAARMLASVLYLVTYVHAEQRAGEERRAPGVEPKLWRTQSSGAPTGQELKHEKSEESANDQEIKYKLSYCWQICPDALHRNKATRVNVADNESSLKTVPRSVLLSFLTKEA